MGTFLGREEGERGKRHLWTVRDWMDSLIDSLSVPLPGKIWWHLETVLPKQPDVSEYCRHLKGEELRMPLRFCHKGQHPVRQGFTQLQMSARAISDALPGEWRAQYCCLRCIFLSELEISCPEPLPYSHSSEMSIWVCAFWKPFWCTQTFKTTLLHLAYSAFSSTPFLVSPSQEMLMSAWGWQI